MFDPPHAENTDIAQNEKQIPRRQVMEALNDSVAQYDSLYRKLSLPVAPQKKSHLPLVALLLTFVAPFVFMKLNEFVLSQILSYAALFAPLLGMLLAIISLCLGKKRIGADGVAMSIVVLLVPIVGIAALLAFFAALGPIDLSHM